MYYFCKLFRTFIVFPFREIHKCRNSKIVYFKTLQFHYSAKKLGNEDSFMDEEFDYSHNSELYYKPDYKAITSGNKIKIRALKLLLMQLETMSGKGHRLPKMIGTKHWQTLLSLTNEEIDSYLNHLLKIEQIRESAEQEKLKNQVHFNNQNFSNRLFCETVTEHIPKLYDSKLMNAMMYGPHIIIDCSCEQLVSRTTIWRTAYYMFEAWIKNRVFLNPYNVIFCNMDFNGELYSSFMELFSSTKLNPASLLTCTEKSYLDLFTKKELTYLSSYAKTDMEKFNGNKVYIIGALFSPESEITRIRKAREDGVSFIKLPHQKYDNLAGWRKEITVTNYIEILNDIKNGYSWDMSFRHMRKDPMLDQIHFQRRMKRVGTRIQNKFREDFRQDLKR